MILPVIAIDMIATAAPRIRAVRQEPDLTRILWVGAHPDDETLIAPLLGKECVEGVSECTLLVMTVGENGGSGATRAEEMQSAAALLHANLIQWTEPDLMGAVAQVWPRELLVYQIAEVIARVEPTAIITFDPAHGSSCHPAHRFTGAMVVDAAGDRPVYFVETTYTSDFVFRNAVTSSRALITFEVGPTWHYLVDNTRVHASQFSAAQSDALENVEPKRLYLMPASAAPTAHYDVTCP